MYFRFGVQKVPRHFVFQFKKTVWIVKDLMYKTQQKKLAAEKLSHE